MWASEIIDTLMNTDNSTAIICTMLLLGWVFCALFPYVIKPIGD